MNYTKKIIGSLLFVGVIYGVRQEEQCRDNLQDSLAQVIAFITDQRKSPHDVGAIRVKQSKIAGNGDVQAVEISGFSGARVTAYWRQFTGVGNKIVFCAGSEPHQLVGTPLNIFLALVSDELPMVGSTVDIQGPSGYQWEFKREAVPGYVDKSQVSGFVN